MVMFGIAELHTLTYRFLQYLSLDFYALICIFLSYFFCYQAPSSVGGQSDQFSLHSSHQGNEGLSMIMTKKL